MNKLLSIAGLLLLVSLATTATAQKKVYLSKSVIATAQKINFDYKDAVKKAQNKDQKATVRLLEFGRILDGQELREHAITCLELIPNVGDWDMALAIQTTRPTFKKALMQWLTKAQKSTQKESLKKPIKKWAPYTWLALNEKPVVKPTSQPAQGASDASQGGGSLQNSQQDTNTKTGVDAATIPAKGKSTTRSKGNQ